MTTAEIDIAPAEINSYGEHCVTAWLTATGYQCQRICDEPGSTDIEARGRTNMLVQIKTAQYPDLAPAISAEEKRGLKSCAASMGHEAWLAQVQVDSTGHRVGKIAWTKLN